MIIIYFIVSFVLALCLTPLVAKNARRFNIQDNPILDERKIHKEIIPLMGGVAIFASFFLVLFLLYFFKFSIFTHISFNQLLALFGGSLILMLGGFLDDKYNLRPKYQIIFPIVASLIIVLVGTNLKEITNPFGGIIKLDSVYLWPFFTLVDAVIFFWLMGMMYTTKLLDGLDGLVAGLTSIASLMICFLSLTPKFYQLDVAIIAGIFAAANLGFLFFNFYPAKIFLGEGGSLFSGFVLGFLSIVAGGKIATALLVFGIAALDVFLVMARRLIKNKPIFMGDSAHLHHRLLKAGFSQRQIVVSFYLLAAIFGALTLFLQSKEKFIAIIALFLIAIIIGIIVDRKAQ